MSIMAVSFIGGGNTTAFLEVSPSINRENNIVFVFNFTEDMNNDWFVLSEKPADNGQRTNICESIKSAILTESRQM
jgi:hypothetical protein